MKMIQEDYTNESGAIPRSHTYSDKKGDRNYVGTIL